MATRAIGTLGHALRIIGEEERVGSKLAVKLIVDSRTEIISGSRKIREPILNIGAVGSVLPAIIGLME